MRVTVSTFDDRVVNVEVRVHEVFKVLKLD